MAKIGYAKSRARTKSRLVYRQNIKKPKKQVVKKFANFVGKVTFEQAKRSKSRPSRRTSRRPKKRYNSYRKFKKSRSRRFKRRY